MSEFTQEEKQYFREMAAFLKDEREGIPHMDSTERQILGGVFEDMADEKERDFSKCKNMNDVLQTFYK